MHHNVPLVDFQSISRQMQFQTPWVCQSVACIEMIPSTNTCLFYVIIMIKTQSVMSAVTRHSQDRLASVEKKTQVHTSGGGVKQRLSSEKVQQLPQSFVRAWKC